MDYQEISEREQYWRSEVERLLNQAQETDQEEDQRFGVGQPADPLPDDLANAQKRLQRLQQAKTGLEQEARSSCKPLAPFLCANAVAPAKRSKVGSVNWQDRAHFFAVSATMMRRILVDRARQKGVGKRGRAGVHVNLDDAPEVASKTRDRD